MPIPKPRPGEEEEEFISRCLSAISDEYENDVAQGICYSQWDDRKEADSTEKKTLDLQLEIKQVDDDGSFEGIAAVYGNVDLGGDIILSGAFKKSLAKDSVKPILWQHDTRNPIGVGTFTDSKNGLMVKGKLNLDETTGGYPKVPKAHEAHALLKQGSIKGLSIGYSTVKADYDSEGIRKLKELELWETSIVTFPMNPKAKVTNVKAEEQITELLDLLVKECNLNINSERKEKIEAYMQELNEHKEGRTLSKATLAKVKAAYDALQSAHEALGTLLQSGEDKPQDDEKGIKEEHIDEYINELQQFRKRMKED